MKTRRYSVLFRVLCCSTIGLFVLLAAAGVAAYTLYSGNGTAEETPAKIDDIAEGPGPHRDAPTAVRPPSKLPVEILATPPRELLAARDSASQTAVIRPSSPSTTIIRAPASAPTDTPVEVRRAIPVTHRLESNEPVEVRRAIPVSYPSHVNATRPSAAAAPSQVLTPPNITERQTVETLPDGRTRITLIRTVRTQTAAQGTAALAD